MNPNLFPFRRNLVESERNGWKRNLLPREDVSINIFACQCEFASIIWIFFIAEAFGSQGESLMGFLGSGNEIRLAKKKLCNKKLGRRFEY